ncbi:MAG TPA: LysE family translocator [Steroidobacteraceae bacterium]|jgi:threonine/homoserine/homoserine lactone efflux protein|nr:LysE family translocator [Steroidobacteraceae bacterium]
MSLYGFAVFCAAYLLAVATPGPGVAAVIARSLTHGMRGAPSFIAGFLVGDLIWFAAATAGLAALAQTAQSLFLAVRYAGAVYLLYLAYRLWTAPAQPLKVDAIHASQRPLRLFLGSLWLTLGNPKPMIFFVALLPTVVHLQSLRFEGYLLIAFAVTIILPLVLGAYAFTASRARRFFQKPKSIRLLNRGAGTAMAGAAVVVATQ